jgi:hypothetical protein
MDDHVDDIRKQYEIASGCNDVLDHRKVPGT